MNLIKEVEALVDFCQKKGEERLWPTGPTGCEYLSGIVRVKPDGTNRGSFVEGLDDLDKTISFLNELDFFQVEVSPAIQFRDCQYFQAVLPKRFRARTGILTVAECRDRRVEIKLVQGLHGDELVASQPQNLPETHIISAIVDDGMLSTWYPGLFTAANPDPEHRLPIDPAEWQDEWAVKIHQQ